MLKIYCNNKATERELLAFLAEFKCRTFTNSPYKGMTRKVRGTTLYKVVNYPLQ